MPWSIFTGSRSFSAAPETHRSLQRWFNSSQCGCSVALQGPVVHLQDICYAGACSSIRLRLGRHERARTFALIVSD
jgi:hypothetical protein